MNQVRHGAMLPDFLLRKLLRISYKHQKILPCSTNPVSKYVRMLQGVWPNCPNLVVAGTAITAASDVMSPVAGPAASAFRALVDRWECPRWLHRIHPWPQNSNQNTSYVQISDLEIYRRLDQVAP